MAQIQEHKPYPSTNQMRDLLSNMQHHFPERQKVELQGSVKLHGTHLDVMYHPSEQKMWFQSRNRVISPEHDNCGSAVFLASREHILLPLLQGIAAVHGDCSKIMLAGEFCGAKVQSGVALCKLPRMFVVFAIQVDDVWQNLAHYEVEQAEHQIYSILRAPTYVLTMDMSRPDEAHEEMMRLTAAVEQECPFAATLGVSGTGEGIVWKSLDPALNSSRFWIKTKGEKHAVSVSRKERPAHDESTAAAIAVAIDAALLEPRLQQGLDYLREMEHEANIKSLGIFIKWVVDDTMKEEGDSFSELPEKLVKAEIGRRARLWYKAQC